ncbi:MAG: hypothetical protein Kilf2KO_15710 [Rhodospirillales bacterium]
MKPLLHQRPALEAALLLDWRQAVGEELAALCQPVKLRQERRGGSRVGSLEVACLAWGALELQHRAPQVMDRVNTFLGVSAVQRIKIKQVARLAQPGPAARRPAQAPRPGLPPAAPIAGPSSGHAALDRALARLAGSVARRGDHEDAT